MVAEGFKNTEIGIIPEDWQTINLGTNFTLKARIGWQGLTTNEYLKNGNYGLVTGTDFKNGYIDWNNCVFVEKVRFDQDKNIQLKEEDVLITKDGTIGKVAYIDRLPQSTTLNSGVFVIRPKTKSINNRFFYYVLMSFYFDDFLSRITAGSTITHLYQKDFIHFNFVCPPIIEQKAIAEALSDADAWIANLEQLIAKKRLIKQGAMQQLLSPKEDWEVKKISEIADVKSGKRLPKGIALIDKDNGHPYIRVSDMRNGTILKNQLKFVPSEVLSQISSYIITSEDIYISVAGTLGLVGIIQKELSGCNLTENANRLTNLKCNQTFLLKVLESPLIQDKIIASQTLGAQPKLALQRIRDFEIFLPKSISNQTRIATILSDMDSEIESLEKQLAKARQIKQGMMQELLTGRVRLV